MQIKSNGSSVTINGANYAGRNIVINNNIVSVDGVVQNQTFGNNPIIVTVNGDVDELQITSGEVIVNGDIKSSINTTSGDVTAINIEGNVVTVSGDVIASNITGSVKTVSGDIN